MIASLCFELWASQLGYTALIRAARKGNNCVVGLLLDRGADMEAKDNVSRSLPSSPNLPGRAARLGRAHCHSVGPRPRRGAMTAGREALQRAGHIGVKTNLWPMGGRWVGWACAAGWAGWAGRSSIPVCRPV